MKNYKMVLAYDGTRYNGWQKQGNTENTIQEKLERILQEISGAETEVFGSGRTDAGTHATGQVMNFHINWNGTAEQLLDAFNAKLPEDIAALSIAEMPPRFHSRLSAKAKHYSYSIWIGKHSPVFERKYTFRCTETLDVQAMRQAAAAFIGTHDFKSFCANKRMKKSTVRTIYDIVFEETEDKLTLHFYGNGFLPDGAHPYGNAHRGWRGEEKRRRSRADFTGKKPRAGRLYGTQPRTFFVRGIL